MRILSLAVLAANASATLMYTDLTLTSNNPTSCTGCESDAFWSPDEVKKCLSNVPSACQYSLKVIKTGEPDDAGAVTVCPNSLGFTMKDLTAEFTDATYLPGSSIGFTAFLPASDTCAQYYWKSSTDRQCTYPTDGTQQTVMVKEKALIIEDATPNVFDHSYNFQGETGKTCASKFDRVVLRHLDAKISVKGLQGPTTATTTTTSTTTTTISRASQPLTSPVSMTTTTTITTTTTTLPISGSYHLHMLPVIMTVIMYSFLFH